MSFNFGTPNFVPPTTLARSAEQSSSGFQLKAPTLKKTEPVNSTSSLPADVLKHCLCHFCNCYVNVAPVRFISNRVACGRCLAHSDGVRLFMVEALAKMHNFPCRYENHGCSELLAPGSVESHERACDFKQVSCLVTGCSWDGTKSEIRPHYELTHKSEIIDAKTAVKLNLKEPKTLHLLYTKKTVPYIVTISIEADSVKHSILSFCTDLEAMGFYYDIKFSANFRDLTFSKQKVQSYDHDNSVGNENIPLTLLSAVFGQTHEVQVFICVKSNLMDGVKTEDISITDIECLICMEPMLGQIYIRKCGHSVCEGCSTNLKDRPCPVCRSGPGLFDNVEVGLFGQPAPSKSSSYQTRNYSLERIIRKVKPFVQ